VAAGTRPQTGKLVAAQQAHRKSIEGLAGPERDSRDVDGVVLRNALSNEYELKPSPWEESARVTLNCARPPDGQKASFEAR